MQKVGLASGEELGWAAAVAGGPAFQVSGQVREVPRPDSLHHTWGQRVVFTVAPGRLRLLR